MRRDAGACEGQLRRNPDAPAALNDIRVGGRDGVLYTATFSACGTYRYKLERIWAPGRPWLNVVGLNPSTADENTDDNTIRRCMSFAQDWGFGGLWMTNLSSLRSTDPKVLRRPDFDIWTALHYAGITHQNDGMVLVAWGAHELAAPHGRRLLLQLAHEGVPAYCLGRTKAGHPRHPLYLARTTKPELLRPPEVEATCKSSDLKPGAPLADEGSR